MRLIKLTALFSLVISMMATQASAKDICKNNQTTLFWINQSQGKYECRHNTKFYELEKCDAGYTYSGGKCTKTELSNLTEPKCSLGNWKCEINGIDKCYSKKSCQGNFKGKISCSGLNSKSLIKDHKGKTDFCGKEKTTTKNRSTNNCPAGFKKSSYKVSSGANGYEKYYCITAL